MGLVKNGETTSKFSLALNNVARNAAGQCIHGGVGTSILNVNLNT